MKLTALITKPPAYKGGGLGPILDALATTLDVTCIYPENIRPQFLNNIKLIAAPPIPAGLVKLSLYKTMQLPSLLKKAGGEILVTDNELLTGKLKKPLIYHSVFGNKQLESIAVFEGNNATQCFAPLHGDVRHVSYAEASHTKDALTVGHEFFLVYINRESIARAVDILKAYTIFKKWQRSSFKLLLMFEDGLSMANIPNIESYAHKADLYACTTAEMPAAVNACFAALCPSDKPDELLLGMHAHKAQKPFIAMGSAVYKSCHGTAFLPAGETVQSWADAMMYAYKHEAEMKLLTERGLSLTTPFTLDNTAAIILGRLSAAI